MSFIKHVDVHDE